MIFMNMMIMIIRMIMITTMTCKTSRMVRRTTLREAMHGELSTHSSQPLICFSIV